METSTWYTVSHLAEDLAPTDFGLHTVWRSAQNSVTWSRIVNMATLRQDARH